ncbi:MAG TPA: 4-phosphoerythronate dehydrogenase [Ignavibacteriaceae bacterium]|nr:4-phosphoerythronate dehydrogenase [Ignavibacteriaceae bacterium]
MILVVDENISFAEEAFSQFGEVRLLPGRKITRETLLSADALIVRSITKVDENLLRDTPVKFVGTATIGTDHVDLEYLKSNKIIFKDAAGCNADAVAEYVFTSISLLANEYSFSFEEKTLGVIGVGNIGSRVARLAESVGMKVLKNDPPLQRRTGSNEYVSLEEALNADIITFHVPLNLEGVDKTFHLINAEKLSSLKRGTILINASRGQVIDNSVLVKFIKEKSLLVNLDVWENEPDINIDLLNQVCIATPHIAGYSLEGKINGTVIIYNALCSFLKVKPMWNPIFQKVREDEITINYNGKLTATLTNIFKSAYAIKEDDARMRGIENLEKKDRSAYFDKLRKEYPFRREFSNYKAVISNGDERILNIIKSFRFQVEII